jgi:hypothetical protein
MAGGFQQYRGVILTSATTVEDRPVVTHEFLKNLIAGSHHNCGKRKTASIGIKV